MLTSPENELFPGKKPTKPNWLYLKEEHTPKESDVAGWIQGWTQVYQLLETLKLHENQALRGAVQTNVHHPQS